MVFSDLPSKPVAAVFSGLASKPMVTVSPDLASKPVVEGFLVCASKPAEGYGFLVTSQNRREDGVGVEHASRSSGLFHVEANWARVSPVWPQDW
jgi:hypothetical protein